MAGSPPVVITDENPTAEHHRTKRQNESWHSDFKGAPPLAEERSDSTTITGTPNVTPKRAAIHQNGDAQRHQHSIARASEMENSRERSHNQRASYGGHRTAPIAIHPVAGDAQPDDDQTAAEQSPARRKPALQGPKYRAAHDASAQKHANPGVAEQLPESQDRALRRRVLGRVVGN